MPQLRTFKVGDEVYDIPEEEVGGFLDKFNDAQEVVSFVQDKDTFDIPINEVEGFKKAKPDAKALHEDIEQPLATAQVDTMAQKPKVTVPEVDTTPPAMDTVAESTKPRTAIFDAELEASPEYQGMVKRRNDVASGIYDNIMSNESDYLKTDKRMRLGKAGRYYDEAIEKQLEERGVKMYEEYDAFDKEGKPIQSLNIDRIDEQLDALVANRTIDKSDRMYVRNNIITRYNNRDVEEAALRNAANKFKEEFGVNVSEVGNLQREEINDFYNYIASAKTENQGLVDEAKGQFAKQFKEEFRGAETKEDKQNVQRKFIRQYQNLVKASKDSYEEKTNSLIEAMKGTESEERMARFKELLGESWEEAAKAKNEALVEEFKGLDFEEKYAKAFNLGVMDVLDSASGAMNLVGVDEMGYELQDYVMNYNTDPENVIPELEGMSDPDWWLVNGTRMLPMMGVLAAVSIPTGGLAGRGVASLVPRGMGIATGTGVVEMSPMIARAAATGVGGLTQWGLETLSESASFYNQAILQGMSEEQAAQGAADIWKIDSGTLALNMLQMLPFYSKKMSWLKAAAIESTSEGLEEVIQEYAQAKQFDESLGILDFAFSKQGLETFTLGTVVGNVMTGAKGVGDMWSGMDTKNATAAIEMAEMNGLMTEQEAEAARKDFEASQEEGQVESDKADTEGAVETEKHTVQESQTEAKAEQAEPIKTEKVEGKGVYVQKNANGKYQLYIDNGSKKDLGRTLPTEYKTEDEAIKQANTLSEKRGDKVYILPDAEKAVTGEESSTEYKVGDTAIPKDVDGTPLSNKPLKIEEVTEEGKIKFEKTKGYFPQERVGQQTANEFMESKKPQAVPEKTVQQKWDERVQPLRGTKTMKDVENVQEGDFIVSQDEEGKQQQGFITKVDEETVTIEDIYKTKDMEDFETRETVVPREEVLAYKRPEQEAAEEVVSEEEVIEEPPIPPTEATEPIPEEAGKKKRKFAKRFEKTKGYKETKKEVSELSKYYDEKTNKISDENAEKLLNDIGEDAAKEIVRDKGNTMNPVDRVFVGMKLIERFDKAKRHEDSARMAEFLWEYGTEMGQGIQAYVNWSKMHPETRVRVMDRELSKQGIELTEHQKKRRKELLQAIKDAPEGTPKWEAEQDLQNYMGAIKGVDYMDLSEAIWYSHVLSGFSTHQLNFGANMFETMGVLWQSVAYNAINNPKAVSGLFTALYDGWGRGLMEAKYTWQTGYSPIHTSKYETGRPDILEYTKFKGGKWNPLNYYKYVSRAMKATDVLFFHGLKGMRLYELAARQEADGKLTKAEKADIQEKLYQTKEQVEKAKAQASNEARIKNLKGKDRSSYIKRRTREIMDLNVNEEMIEDANDVASRGTFNYDPEGAIGAFTKNLQRLVDNMSFEIKGVGRVTPLRRIVPFTRIISNVTNNYLDWTPYGFARVAAGGTGMLLEKDSQFRREYTPEQRAKVMISATTGTMAMVALWALTEGWGDEEPLLEITADGTGNFQKNYQLKQGGWQEYSVKVGDRWISYKNTPLAIGLSAIGFLRDSEKYKKYSDEEIETKMMLIGINTVKYVTDMTFLKGLSDFMTAFGENDPDKSANIISKVLTQSAKGYVVPNLVTQTSRYMQDIMNLPMKDADNFLERTIRDIPVARRGQKDIINVFGEPVVPETDRWIHKDEEMPMVDFLNENNLWVGRVSQGTVRLWDDKENGYREVTDDEYYSFSKLRGQHIKRQLEEDLEDLKTMSDEELSTYFTNLKRQATQEAKYLLQEKL